MQATNEIDKLKNILESHISQSYLDQYLQKPALADEKLAFLYQMAEYAQLDIRSRNKYIINAMLVQTALDTHDLVAKHNDKSEHEQADQETQLTVLAGDYYSGLYYYLLSIEEDIEYIRALSIAIKEVNEWKMKLYYLEEPSDFAMISSLVRHTESTIVLAVADYLGIDADADLARDFFLAALLVSEKEDEIQIGTSKVFDLWTKDRSEKALIGYRRDRDAFLDKQIALLAKHSGLWKPLTAELSRRYRMVDEKALNRREG